MRLGSRFILNSEGFLHIPGRPCCCWGQQLLLLLLSICAAPIMFLHIRDFYFAPAFVTAFKTYWFRKFKGTVTPCRCLSIWTGQYNIHDVDYEL